MHVTTKDTVPVDWCEKGRPSNNLMASTPTCGDTHQQVTNGGMVIIENIFVM